MKSCVPTSFYVFGDVLNIKNKVLNGNTSLEEALLVPALWFFHNYTKYVFFKSCKGNSLNQNRFSHVKQCPKVFSCTNQTPEKS